MNSQQLIDNIVIEFGLPEDKRTHPISNKLVKGWMSSTDINVLGTVSSFVFKKEYFRRIKPPLTFEEHHDFLLSYYERCLIEDPDGEWVDSSYEAGWATVNWFRYLWSKKELHKDKVVGMKWWLERLYKNADQKLKNCLVNAILEHLFEDKEITVFFKDWGKDIALKKAYHKAIEWRAKPVVPCKNSIRK